MKSLVLAACLLLSVCALAQHTAKEEDVALAARGAQALKQQFRDPDSLQISKVVVTTRTYKDGSAVDVCYEYRTGEHADHEMAIYSSANGKEKLKFGDQFLHNSRSECNFDAKVTRKMKSTSTDITAVFKNLSLGETSAQAK